MCCDTLVAIGRATKDGSMIFGKNSDRPYNEIQNIIFYPHHKHSEKKVKCTYITIPQVSETLAILLSQPIWMFGGEMGANEYGVVIGNEAVWTKEPDGPTALLGMDLLRLGLERGETAEEALNVIIQLLEEFGQGGDCAEGGGMTYHNSFIIADSKEAWVLETADKWWVAERIRDNVRNISNELSIRTQFDRAAKGIEEYSIKAGYRSSNEKLDFASNFSSNYISDEPSPYCREGKAKLLLEYNNGKMTPRLMMEFLRDHEGGICMHGGFRSTAALVSRVTSEFSVHWVTGTPNPCQSMFKPVFIPGTYVPDYFKPESQKNNSKLLWHVYEKAVNTIGINKLNSELRELEDRFYQDVMEFIKDSNFDQEKAKKISKAAFDAEWDLYQNIIK
ncbi:MAG: C69 family dipeptidase [Candidatus Helarchaeota archaeon]